MRRFILLISVFLGMFVQYSLAQVDSHFSLFEYAQNVSNPGAAGSNEAMCVTSMHRQQWVGFEGHPQTTVFTFDMPIPKMPIGIGLTVNEDGLGYQKDLNVGINGSYRVELDFGMLGVGVGLGIINRSIDADWITWESMNGGTVYQDPAIPHMESKTSFDMSFGATLVNEKYWVGVSATHLLQPTINFDIELPSKVKRHYYLTGGYVYSLPNPSFDLLPAVIVQSDGSTMEAAINAKILYEKKFWGGLSYRYNDAIVPMVGVHLVNGISFAYSYDIVISQMAGNTGGTHELMVRYCFSVDGGKTPGRYRSVRRL